MKNILITIALLFTVSAVQAQIETQILGKWKVVGVEANEKMNDKEAKQLEALKKARLEFSADGHAKFKQIFSSFYLPDAYWEYNKEFDAIFLYNWKDRKKVHMRLWYEETETGYDFYIDETPFILHVERE